jgi:hypothetical protein
VTACNCPSSLCNGSDHCMQKTAAPQDHPPKNCVIHQAVAPHSAAARSKRWVAGDLGCKGSKGRVCGKNVRVEPRDPPKNRTMLLHPSDTAPSTTGLQKQGHKTLPQATACMHKNIHMASAQLSSAANNPLTCDQVTLRPSHPNIAAIHGMHKQYLTKQVHTLN